MLFNKFHKHKLKVSRPLDTGLYKTPAEIAHDNYKYFRAIIISN
jgi:hypothetical protein